MTWITLSIFMFGVVLWFTNLIPAAVTGILMIVLFALFDVLTFEEAVSGLGHEIIWLVISVLMIGVAVEKSSLDKRLAYSLLSLSKGNSKAMILLLILASFLLTFIIPNAVGRLTVLLPISLGIINLNSKEEDKNFAKAIMLAVTFTPYVSTITLITGASGSIYAAGLFDSMLGFTWSYIHWLIVMLPIPFVILIILWLILILIFPSKHVYIQSGKEFFQSERMKLGKLSPEEIRLIALCGILMSLWITKELHQMSIAMSAVLVVILFFIPGIDLLNWKDTIKRIDWSIPFLFTAGFAIAQAFEKSGVIDLISSFPLVNLHQLSAFQLTVVMMVLIIIVRLAFTNFNTIVASIMPVVITFALGTPYNPVWLGMICLVASSTAYLLPTQAIGSMLTYSQHLYTGKDMLKAGFLLTLAIISMTLLLAFTYWPLVGLPIK